MEWKMEKLLKGFLMAWGALALLMAVNLLMAFPVKWTWNATMPYLFALPALTWGKAWCLTFLASVLVKGTAAK